MTRADAGRRGAHGGGKVLVREQSDGRPLAPPSLKRPVREHVGSVVELSERPALACLRQDHRGGVGPGVNALFEDVGHRVFEPGVVVEASYFELDQFAQVGDVVRQPEL